MIKSILIPQLIYNALKDNKSIKNIVNNRIFPLVAENGTKFPFVVFSRDNISEKTNTKDGLTEDTVTFTITCVHDKYFECLKLAQEIREAVEVRWIYDDDINIKVRDIELLSISETYSENAYVEELSFSCNVSYYIKDKDKE